MHQARETRHTLKIVLQSPITHQEVNRLITTICAAENSAHLIINFGKHEFTSLAVLRNCKEALNQIAEKLEQFERIAFIVPPPYQGVNQAQLRYFTGEEAARQWLTGLTAV